MKTAVRKLRSPVKWHGGKSYLCRRFINLFPEHDLYIEPFAGGLSTLLNKPPAKYEIVSDLNVPLVETWRTLRDFGREIIQEIQEIEYSESSFVAAQKCAGAIAFIVRNRMSRGGLGKDFAWSDRLRGGKPGDMNAWETFVNEDLPRVVERIQNVKIVCLTANETIDYTLAGEYWRICDNPLIYADPPYLHETRTHKAAYDHEMTRDDHHDLISCLRRADERGAKVFLSGYHSDAYQEWIPRDWIVHEFEMPNHSGQGKSKQRRVEVLWESPDR